MKNRKNQAFLNTSKKYYPRPARDVSIFFLAPTVGSFLYFVIR